MPPEPPITRDSSSDAGASTAAAFLIEERAPLSEATSFRIGGPAEVLVRLRTPAALDEAFAFARTRGGPLWVLGGGSNVLIADDGVPGIVLRYEACGCEILGEDAAGAVRVRVAGGTPWDDVVRFSVDHNLAGIECLSGIPGWAGAAPVQNIGAYGQEVAESLAAVHVVDLDGALEPGARGADVVSLPAAACGFGYRQSHFKGQWRGRYLVVALELRLHRGAAPTIRYPELQRAVAQRVSSAPTLADVRREVIALRRGKGMLGDVVTEWDPPDQVECPDRCSAGSFFMNPIVTATVADRVAAVAFRREGREADMPRYSAGEGWTKLSAAWLIERAGFTRGFSRGRAGISTRHTLALVNLGGATAAEVLALAAEIREGVEAAFGVRLEPEPIMLPMPGLP